MSYKTTSKRTKELNADNVDQAIVKLEDDLSKSFQLKVHDVKYDELRVAVIQLEDLAVNVVEAPKLHIRDYSDPYNDDEEQTDYATLHIFFPEKKDDSSARKLVLKLVMEDNISVYFHEFSESKDTSTQPPKIVFDTDEELLGNSMVHIFIETTQSSEAAFYMKSRNCVDVMKSEEATSSGTWTLMHSVLGEASQPDKYYSHEISSYLETDEAKVWHSGSSMSLADAKPYIMFDKIKNVWIVADEDFGYATAWQDAASKELMFPSKRAKAVWKEA